MSITRSYGNIEFSCDECGDDFETGVADFGLALELAKTEGWRARKHSDEWLHFCSDECEKEFRDAQD